MELSTRIRDGVVAGPGLDDLVAEFEAEHGPIPEELVREAMREWPDYEDE
jgi:hypothetical protein